MEFVFVCVCVYVCVCGANFHLVSPEFNRPTPPTLFLSVFFVKFVDTQTNNSIQTFKLYKKRDLPPN